MDNFFNEELCTVLIFMLLKYLNLLNGIKTEIMSNKPITS